MQRCPSGVVRHAPRRRGGPGTGFDGTRCSHRAASTMQSNSASYSSESSDDDDRRACSSHTARPVLPGSERQITWACHESRSRVGRLSLACALCDMCRRSSPLSGETCITSVALAGAPRPKHPWVSFSARGQDSASHHQLAPVCCSSTPIRSTCCAALPSRPCAGSTRRLPRQLRWSWTSSIGVLCSLSAVFLRLCAF